MTRDSRRDQLSDWYYAAYGRGRAIYDGSMSIDIGCLQFHIAVWQLPSARCELTSTVGRLTSTVCQFTSTRIQLQRAQGIGRGRMPTDIGLLRIDLDPSATAIGLLRIPATRRRLTSPHCELTSGRRKRPLRRLPVVPRPGVPTLSPSQGGFVCLDSQEPKPTSQHSRCW